MCSVIKKRTYSEKRASDNLSLTTYDLPKQTSLFSVINGWHAFDDRRGGKQCLHHTMFVFYILVSDSKSSITFFLSSFVRFQSRCLCSSCLSLYSFPFHSKSLSFSACSIHLCNASVWVLSTLFPEIDEPELVIETSIEHL